MNPDRRRYLHKLVWDWRAKYEDIYATPDRLDSAKFFVCEYAEALDADLRTNEKYLRNRSTNLDVNNELADTAIMLITALGRKYNPHWDHWSISLSGTTSKPSGILTIGIHVAKSWLWILETPRSIDVADNEIWKSLWAIDRYTDDIDDYIQRKLDELYQKHVSK